MSIKLSYIVTTYNKLDYLRLTLPLLIAECKADEEIVVTDGGSTDGSAELITEFYKQGKIHQFVSEKDFGEAHGYNKAMLMAKGNLIKFITDDDAFDYKEIAKCRKYMEDNPEIDLLATDGVGGVNIENKIVEYSFAGEFKKWTEDRTPFTFTCLGLMIRKSSIALTGLLNPSFKRVDAEFGFRVTSSKCKMAWYTGFTWFHVGNNDSNSNKFHTDMITEMERLISFYIPVQKKSTKAVFSKVFRTSKKILFGSKEEKISGIQRTSFENADRLLINTNKKREGQFSK